MSYTRCKSRHATCLYIQLLEYIFHLTNPRSVISMSYLDTESKKRKNLSRSVIRSIFIKGFFNDVINFFYGIIFHEFEKH